MKRYFLAVAAALVVALVGAGGALATNLPSPGLAPGLLPNLAPQSEAWLNALSVLPASPTPPRARRRSPRRARRLSRSRLNGQAATLSIYEHSAQPWILAAQGCAAAKRQRERHRRPRLRHAGVRARRLRDAPLLRPFREEPQDHGRAARLRQRLLLLPPGRLDGVDRDRARDEQLPPGRAERLRRRRPLGPRDEHARADPRRERTGRARHGLPRPTTQSPPGIGSSARRATSSTASARPCTVTRSMTTARSTAESERSGARGRHCTSPAASATRRRCPRSTTPRWRANGPSWPRSHALVSIATSTSRA